MRTINCDVNRLTEVKLICASTLYFDKNDGFVFSIEIFDGNEEDDDGDDEDLKIFFIKSKSIFSNCRKKYATLICSPSITQLILRLDESMLPNLSNNVDMNNGTYFSLYFRKEFKFKGLCSLLPFQHHSVSITISRLISLIYRPKL